MLLNSDWLQLHHGELRFLCFFALLGLFTLLEARFGARAHKAKWLRWRHNIGLVFFNGFMLRLAFPFAAVGVANFAQQAQLGIFNSSDATIIPLWLKVLFCILLLDLAIYWQHRAFHHWSWLWRIHSLHHADTQLDCSTAGRFHTFELVISFAFKALVIIAIGAPTAAAIIFELMLASSAQFNHSNIRLPAKVERYLRPFIVTPAMHSIHHSKLRKEHDSNFGFFISAWDRLFKTYTQQSQQEPIEIGLSYEDGSQSTRLQDQLRFPFKPRENKQP